MVRNIKRFIAFTIILCLMLTIVPVTAAASDALSVSKTEACIGDTVTVSFTQPVTLTMSGITLGIAFDKDAFEIIEMANAPYAAFQPDKTNCNNVGRIAVSWTDPTYDANTALTAGTVLLSVTFAVKEDAELGDKAFSVTEYIVTGGFDMNTYMPEDITPDIGSTVKTVTVTSVPEVPEVAVIIGVENTPENAVAGKNFTVDITLRSDAEEAQKLTALNFALIYDTDLLELVSLIPVDTLPGEAVTNGDAFGWNGAMDGIYLSDTAATIATAKFKVKSDIDDGVNTSISLGKNTNTGLFAKFVDETKTFVPEVKQSKEISLLANTFEFYFISADEYKAIENTTKILVIKAEQNDTTYTFGDINFYWSSKYNAYVAIVGVGITDDNVRALVKAQSGKDADEIGYLGDVNSDGLVTAGDAALVSEMLHNTTLDSCTDLMRFEADVYDTVQKNDTYVTSSDALWILYASVGLNYGTNGK